MSNHFHLLVHAPDQPPSPQDVCDRYHAYYRSQRKLEISNPFCEVLAQRMRDISWFMHDLQQQFASWFNRTRSMPRRGALWANRFKHTLLGDAQAVWECCKYIEMNPVRAGMVADPADYRFSSYGAWSGRGRHPFQENVAEVLLPWLQGMYPFESVKQLRTCLREAFAGITGVREEPDGKVKEFSVVVDRRVRYWVDGLVIGSELFLREMMAAHSHILRRRSDFTQARGPDEVPVGLHCYKQLRAL